MTRKRPAAALSVVLALAAAGAARAATTSAAPPDAGPSCCAGGVIPRRLLFAEVERSHVQISPDGSRVGWIAGGRLFVAPIDAPRSAAALGDGEALAWAWAYTGDLLVERFGAEGGRLHLVDRATGRGRDLTPGGRGASRLVGISPKHPRHAVIAHDAGGTTRLHRVPLDGGPGARLMEARDFERVWVDGDLRVRAGRRASATWTALYRHAPGKGWSRIVSYDAETARLAGVVGLSADGREIFVVDAVDRDKAALKAYDLAAGRWRVLADDPLADLLPQGALLHPRTGGVQAVVSYFGRLRRHTLDPDVALDFEFLGSARSGDVSFVGRSLDDRVWLVRYLDGAPAVYYAWERAARRLTRLFSEAPALDGAPFAARRAVVIAARDGLALPCDLYLPPGSDRDGDGRPEAPLPLLVYVHGGPWLGFERNLWPANRHFQLLANRGYAVVRAEFRGAAGYGRAFMDRGDREWGGRMHDDLADIAAWAVAEGIAERGRIGVWGWSYGGYATLAALAFSPDLFACGVSLYGLADLEDFVGRVVAAGWGDTWTRRVGDPATPEGRLLLRQHSPLRAAHRVRGPLLLSHGALDRITPPDQSAAMVEALRGLGRPVTHLVHPDEGHDYRRPETWRSFWAIAERFLQAHLGGRREPDGVDLDGAAVRIAAGGELIPGLDLDLIDNAAAPRPASSARGRRATAARPAAPSGPPMSQPGITEDPHAHPDPFHVDPADPGGDRRRE